MSWVPWTLRSPPADIFLTAHARDFGRYRKFRERVDAKGEAVMQKWARMGGKRERLNAGADASDTRLRDDE